MGLFDRFTGVRERQAREIREAEEWAIAAKRARQELLDAHGRRQEARRQAIAAAPPKLADAFEQIVTVLREIGDDGGGPDLGLAIVKACRLVDEREGRAPVHNWASESRTQLVLERLFASRFRIYDRALTLFRDASL